MQSFNKKSDFVYAIKIMGKVWKYPQTVSMERYTFLNRAGSYPTYYY